MRFLGWMPGEGTTPAVRDGAPVWASAVATRCSGAASRGTPGWLDPVLAWNRQRGAAANLLERARAALAGEGTVVVTGQQPALAGGPLYTLYKLLTAVELAAEVERTSGRPCQAIFWLVGDDSDFGEVAGTFWPRPDYSVAKIRDDRLPPAGTMIGRLEAEARQAMLFEDPALWPAGPVAASIRVRFEEALRRGGDWSGALAALLFQFWADLPVVFLDGAHPAVVEAQSKWLAEAAGWPLKSLLTEGAAEAQSFGQVPALDPSLGERAIYRITGDRREPPAESRIGPLAPNVVLRPLVQDLLLPNVATIVGPSELRYRAQLGPLYRHGGIPLPRLEPRLRAVLVPPLQDRGRERRLEEDGWLALRDPDRWLSGLVEAETPAAPADAIRGTRERFGRDARQLEPTLVEYDGSLPQLLESVRGKVDFQLQRLEEGFVAKVRQRLFRREPVLTRWKEFVRPRDGEQERSLSLLTPFLFAGGDPPRELRAAARAQVGRPNDEGEAVAVFAMDDTTRGEEP